MCLGVIAPAEAVRWILTVPLIKHAVTRNVHGEVAASVKDALSTPIVPLIKHVVIQNALKGTTASDNVVILTPTVPVVNLNVVASARMV